MRTISALLLLASTLSAAPAIFFTDIGSGPGTGGPSNLGAPIAIFGRGFGPSRGANSKVTIGGVEVANYLAWGQNNANNPWLDMIVVQPGPAITGGPIVVSVNGAASNADSQFQKNSGKILYLSPTGSDSRACSEASPCKTVLNSLASKMKAGDVLLLRGGNYDEGEMWIRDVLGMSGTAAQHKTVKAYPGESVFFTNGSRGVAIAANYLTFSGLHFRNGKGIGVADDYANQAAIGKGVWIIDNTVIGPISYDGIDSHGSDHIIAGNVVRVEHSSQGTQGHCFYISHGDNVKILYNVAQGAPGYGIHVFDQVRQANDYRRTITNLLIEGNVLIGSPERSGMLIIMDDGGGWGTYGNFMDNIVVRNNIFVHNNHHGIVVGNFVRNIKIYNNTFYENGRQAIFIGANPALTGLEIRNNVFYQSDNNGICKNNCSWYPVAHVHDEAGDRSRVTIEGNGYFPGASLIVKGSGSHTSPIAADAHPVTGAAGFTDPAAMDFSLTAKSSAIGKGASLLLSPHDFNGGLRPTGAHVSLGAFDYGSGPGAPGAMTYLRPPPPPAPKIPNPNAKPTGHFDSITSAGTATGWATDPEDVDQPVKIQIFIDKNMNTPGASAPFELTADAPRADGSPHAFNFEIPSEFRDRKEHRVWAWAGGSVLLDGSPQSFKLAPDKSKKGTLPLCGNGLIQKACLCGGVARSDSFCCDGGWFSYDACKQKE